MNSPITGVICLFFGIMLTLVFPIQRGRLSNQLWDLITFVLFAAGSHFLNLWGAPGSLIVGIVAGIVAILIRDFRLWIVRFRDRSYSRGHRYYWYGRARDWYGRRRRRRW
jgi:hypothetical protein